MSVYADADLRVGGRPADSARVTLDLDALAGAVVACDARLHAEWGALVAGDATAPFAHPDWVRAWAVMTGAEVVAVTVRHGSDLVAAYPVVVRGGRVRSAADWHTPHLEPGGDAAAWALLASTLGEGRYRVVVDMATEPVADAFGAALAAAGFRIRVGERARSPWVDLADGWEAYARSVSSKKWRELRRRRRRLDDLGTVTFTEHDGSDGLDDLLDEGFAVEGSGWKTASGTALLVDARVAAFYRQVAHDLARRHLLRLRFLRLDGRAVAFDLAFVHDDAEWLLKTGYDPVLGAWSPGALLRAEALEQACAAGCQTYEFLGSDDAWKLEWTDRTRPVYRVIAVRPGIRGTGVDLADRVRRGVRNRLRRRRRPAGRAAPRIS